MLIFESKGLSHRCFMYRMCYKQLLGRAKKEFDTILKDRETQNKSNVCYALQTMAITSLMKNIGTALKMNLCVTNFAVLQKERKTISSYFTLSLLSNYNHNVLCYCLNLSSHELIEKEKVILIKKL